MLTYFRNQVELAYKELTDSFEGLDERGSWMRLAPKADDYLHSDGSILGQVTHVAGCKVLYTSAAFYDMEIRLQAVTQRTIEIGTSWEAAKQYLSESQEYWLGSWQGLTDSQLEDLVATNWGDRWPIWKVLHSMIAHDHYHAGQIALTRTVAPIPTEPPPPISDEEIAFLKTFSAW